jgi:hypothetical protein
MFVPRAAHTKLVQLHSDTVLTDWPVLAQLICGICHSLVCGAWFASGFYLIEPPSHDVACGDDRGSCMCRGGVHRQATDTPTWTPVAVWFTPRPNRCPRSVARHLSATLLRRVSHHSHARTHRCAHTHPRDTSLHTHTHTHTHSLSLSLSLNRAPRFTSGTLIRTDQ